MPYTLYYKFLGELEGLIKNVLRTKKRVLISVTGTGGTGKSFFGRFLRRNGFGGISRREIAVIDDNEMKLDFLFFFRRRIRIPCNGMDELRPFLKKIGNRKKIVFFLNATPHRRITEADILVILSTDEETRRRRLGQRDSDNPKKLEIFLRENKIEDIKIKYSHMIKAEV